MFLHDNSHVYSHGYGDPTLTTSIGLTHGRQRELSRVLYPVFLHTYLNLVSRDASATASTLLNT